MVVGIRQIKGASNLSVCLCLSCDLWSKSDMYGPNVQRPPVEATLNVFRRNSPNRLEKHKVISFDLFFVQIFSYLIYFLQLTYKTVLSNSQITPIEIQIEPSLIFIKSLIVTAGNVQFLAGCTYPFYCNITEDKNAIKHKNREKNLITLP